jgi:MtN3 and saliva related transmembrane protein
LTTYFAVAAATWGVAMALAPLLQVRAMRVHQSSRAVSVGYQQVLLVGFALWLAYGIALHNLALIIPNTIAGIVSLTTILVAIRCRRTAP